MTSTDPTPTNYDFKVTEEKWRKAWEDVALDTPDLARAKRPFYNLMMFPYPSAEGLHVGNMYAFTGSDIYGRFKRMEGYDIFEPIGLDGFGIHSENFALKIGRHPMDHAKITEKNYYNQLYTIGAMFDWTRTVETYNPDYYRWTQWLFVQMFKRGLAYRGKAEVNWCPSCKTVLADEQVVAHKATIQSEVRQLADESKDLKERDVCERCGNTVQKRQLEQWFFKITAYAEKLLQNSYGLDWSEKIRVAQQSWIGKKEGINITYPVVTENGKNVSELTCFTTRPDTNFGATFVVMAPEHPFVAELLKVKSSREAGSRFAGQKSKVKSVSSDSVGALKNNKADLEDQIQRYVEDTKKKTAQDRIATGRKKTGVFTGFYCVNGLNNKKLPLYISDFVLKDFGSGAVVGVPGHDKRDFEFAMQFDINVERVVIAKDGDTSPISRVEQVQEDEGIMVNSGFLDGMDIHEAKEKMMEYLEKKDWGKRVTTYHLRDWLISRQRYWGPPIPMVYCSSCAQRGQSWFSTKEAQSALGNPKSQIPNSKQIQNSKFKSLEIGNWKLEIPAQSAGWYPVPESDLPVVLPRIDDYKPGDDGVAPLAKHKEFYNVACPECGSTARRETDVSDTFLDSSWYFLRYPSVQNAKCQMPNAKLIQHSAFSIQHSELPWDPEITKRWLPVHMYTGGAEHSVLHLMYSRFVTMALNDWGYIDFEEPFSTFYAHGLVIKDGAKMSKSKGNVVNPDEYIERYGADALRLYLMFTGPYDQGGDFRDSAMEGMSRWVQKVWRLAIRNIFTYDALDSLAPLDTFQHSPVSSATIKKALHRAIKKVSEDIDRRRYNTAIAAMMELVNTVGEEQGVMGIEDLKDFLKILAPFAPYMTEELWQRILSSENQGTIHPRGGGIAAVGGKGNLGGESISQDTFTKSNSIHFQSWPAFDPKFLEEDTVEIAVQVNGRLRGTIQMQNAKCKMQNEIEKIARTSERVAKHLEGKTIKKVVFVPGRLINFVT